MAVVFEEVAFPLRETRCEKLGTQMRLILGKPGYEVQPLRRGQYVEWTAPNREYIYCGRIARVEEGAVCFDTWILFRRVGEAYEGPARMVRCTQCEYRPGEYAL